MRRISACPYTATSTVTAATITVTTMGAAIGASQPRRASMSAPRNAAASQFNARYTAPMSHPTNATTTRLPMIPYMARVMTDPEVPAAGPAIAMMPVRIQGREPAITTRTACHSCRPSRMSVAPTVKFSTLTLGAAHTANRSRARP